MKPGPRSLFPELEKDLRAITGAHSTGILPSQEIERLISSGRIFSDQGIDPAQVQPASLDLRLGTVAYRVRASFLPGERATVESKIDKYRMHELDLAHPAALERGCVYIVPLMEELSLPAEIWGKANPKSTTGRLDIFTRLITDFGTEFDGVPEGHKGKLYLEIVPRTFSVLVQAGFRLSQLRLLRGNPPASDSALDALDRSEQLVFLDGTGAVSAQIERGLWLSIDLDGSPDSEIVGYRAKRHTPLIDLSKTDFYEPLDFWDPVRRPQDGALVLPVARTDAEQAVQTRVTRASGGELRDRGGAPSPRSAPRSARAACGRDQRDDSKRRVIVVVALVEANASALIDPERRAGSGAESRRRGGHRVGEGHAEMQVLAALEKHIAAQARHIDADALNRDARA